MESELTVGANSFLTKEGCVEKYEQCKRSKNGDIPRYREFLKYAGVDARQVMKLFGSSAYSKLQNAAGDAPNKLQMQRTPAQNQKEAGSVSRSDRLGYFSVAG
jgi:hypothetical protein